MSDQEATKAEAKNEPRTATTIEEATKLGFFGTEVDPTPDENYSLKGVTRGKPTPETDAAHAEEVRRKLTANGR